MPKEGATAQPYQPHCETQQSWQLGEFRHGRLVSRTLLSTLFIILIMHLSIATLNVQGFLSFAKQTEVVQLAQAAHIEILLLQETNFRSSSEVFTFKQCFHLECFFSFAASPFCGVGIIVFRRELMHNSHFEHDADGRVIP